MQTVFMRFADGFWLLIAAGLRMFGCRGAAARLSAWSFIHTRSVRMSL